MLPATANFLDAATRGKAFTGSVILLTTDPLMQSSPKYRYWAMRTLRLDGIPAMPGVILSVSGLSIQIDLNTRSTNYQTVTVEALNVPVDPTATIDVSAGVHASASIGAVAARGILRKAEIYLYPGGGVKSLSDCLKVFSGVIRSVNTESGGSTMIYMDNRAEDPSASFKGLINVPTRLFSTSIWPDLPESLVNEPKPLVYGNMDEGYEAAGVTRHFQTGFAIAARINWRILAQSYTYYLIAGHRTKEIGIPWLYLSRLDAWARPTSLSSPYISTSEGTADGGYARGGLILDLVDWYAYLPPTGASSPFPTPADNSINKMWDGSTSTGYTVYADTATTASVVFEFTQEGDPSNDNITNSIGVIYGDDGVFEMYHQPLATITSRKLQVWVNGAWVDMTWPSPVGSGDNMIYAFLLDNYTLTGATGVYWHFGSGHQGASADGSPFKIRFLLTGTFGGAGLPVVNIRHAFLRIPFLYARSHGPMNRGRKMARRGTIVWDNKPEPPELSDVVSPDSIGWEVEGRQFGTWITGREGTRTDDPVALFTTIVKPGDVIESILRDELSAVNADIDTASFDEVSTYGTMRNCYLNLPAGSRVNAKTLCEKIAYEHNLLFFRRANGQFRLVDGFGAAGVKATIQHSELIGGVLKWHHEMPRDMANNGRFVHTYSPRTDSYLKDEIVTTSASISAYGQTDYRPDIEVETVRNRYNETTQNSRLSDWLFGAGAFMAGPHVFIDLDLAGFRHAALEIGDVIKLGSDFDEKEPDLYRTAVTGKNWSTRSFIVYGVAVENASVQIMAFDSAPVYHS